MLDTTWEVQVRIYPDVWKIFATRRTYDQALQTKNELKSNGDKARVVEITRRIVSQ
jgi:hypothetical protein